MNDDQRQIILGTLLGNGYICKGRHNHYLCIRHSSAHFDWLKTKSLELEAYGNTYSQYNTTHTWRSRSHVIFNEFKDLCYKDNKKTVSMAWLDPLRALAIAVWYGDSGCLTGRNGNNACLRTQSFGLDGNRIIEQYFNEVGMPCHINKSRNSWVIVFTVEGTKTLMSKILAPYLPKNRYFKLTSV